MWELPYVIKHSYEARLIIVITPATIIIIIITTTQFLSEETEIQRGRIPGSG